MNKTLSTLVAGAILVGLCQGATAKPQSPSVRQVAPGVNQYTYYGPKKKKKVTKPSEETTQATPAAKTTSPEAAPAPATGAAPEATGATSEGEAPPRTRATTTRYTVPAGSSSEPSYTQDHLPADSTNQPKTQSERTYTQVYAPGPNTGKADNGFFTPGGSSILTTGPIYYPYGYTGGYYQSGYAPGFFNGYQGYPGYPGYNGFYNPPTQCQIPYANQNVINTPIQRLDPPPGTHPAAIFNPAPQTYSTTVQAPNCGCPQPKVRTLPPNGRTNPLAPQPLRPDGF